MFTGIIEAVGKVTGIERGGDAVRLSVASSLIAEDVAIGDSVCINGVCLTATDIQRPRMTFDAVYETMRRTTLNELAIGDQVNLERAVPVGGRLGGHVVQGHVDGTGRIASIRPIGNSWFVYIDTTPELMRYIVTKGSVAVNGISLTVAEAEDRTFALSIIPHTWDNTTLELLRAGDSVNIETDILGKYVEKMLAGYGIGGNTPADSSRDRHGAGRTGVSMDLLTRSGYVTTATATEEAPTRYGGYGNGEDW